MIFCFVLFVLCTLEAGNCYKHVIFMHGILTDPKGEYDYVSKFILKAHPGTNITLISAYAGVESLEPMWTQVNYIRGQMESIMKENPEGVHLLCFSQGGLVCRGVLETLPNHNVDSFVSLSSPQGGQYGDTSYLKYLFPYYLRETLYEIFYSELGQDISIANYWNDPYHQALYKKYSVFLAQLNNDSSNPHSAAFKKSFTRIKNLVLIGGPDDGVITPWQSSQFGSFTENSLNVTLMRQQKNWYIRDSFGLRTLDKRGAVHVITVPGVHHTHWIKNETVFQNHVIKWLT